MESGQTAENAESPTQYLLTSMADLRNLAQDCQKVVSQKVDSMVGENPNKNPVVSEESLNILPRGAIGKCVDDADAVRKILTDIRSTVSRL